MKERKTLLFAVVKFFILMRFSDSSSNSTDTYRRMLHQPLFPEVTTPPPVMQAPPPPPLEVDMPFFPEVPAGKSPYTVETSTTPSNISTSTPSTLPVKNSSSQMKKTAFVLSSSISVLIMVSALGFFWYRNRIRVRMPSKKLLDRNSDQRPTERNGNSSGSGLIYLGTMDPTTTTRHGGSNGSPYHKLSSIQRSEMMRPSPELRPLPPLPPFPPLDSRQMSSRFDQETFYTPNGSAAEVDSCDSSYTPNRISSISSTSMSTTVAVASKGRFIHSCRSTPNFRRVSPKTRLSKSSTEPKSGIGPECREEIQSNFFPPKIPLSSSSPQSLNDSSSKPVNSNELVSQLKKSDIMSTQRGENQSDITQSEEFLLSSKKNNQKLSPSCSEIQDQPNPDSKKSDNPSPPVAVSTPPQPPPPPPLPPSMAGKTKRTGKFISHFPQLTRPQFAENPFIGIQVETKPPETEHYRKEHSESTEAPENEESSKPRLKSLHWDKVRASSDRSMVWDQLKYNSFQLNEDMIESLFISNSTTPVQKEPNRKQVPLQTQQNRVLDPKKSQNIAILLRALNVTREEVTEALLDGNPESLGSDLFETLVKMAPTKEEEIKLRDYNGDISKLGSAERFLKAILDVPCAFERVDAMMYRSNFEAEVQYLRKSFESLEAACNELKNSKLFLKILETVLWTGNRINIGTNRGEAKAFKLDTLLKLADVRGTDGKTSLLHFVVQEIIKSEDLKTNTKSKDDTLNTSGLRVISSLSNELNNVKKAASMDSNVLNSYIMKLETGLEKIKLFILSNPSSTEGKFFQTMKEFIKIAEKGIIEIRHEESRTLSYVKEVTEYFHGDTTREEAHPLRIFMVVRDFLSVLDRVCKEVGKLQEKPIIGSLDLFVYQLIIRCHCLIDTIQKKKRAVKRVAFSKQFEYGTFF